jgi:hypothetical protein
MAVLDCSAQLFGRGRRQRSSGSGCSVRPTVGLWRCPAGGGLVRPIFGGEVKTESSDNKVKKALYVSLFGQSSMDQIKRKLIESAIPLAESHGGVFDGIKHILTIGIKAGSEHYKVLATLNDFNVLMLAPVLLRNTVIVFDDIERKPLMTARRARHHTGCRAGKRKGPRSLRIEGLAEWRTVGSMHEAWPKTHHRAPPDFAIRQRQLCSGARPSAQPKSLARRDRNRFRSLQGRVTSATPIPRYWTSCWLDDQST